ncbi:MAG: trypsin-like peptidase domain-containing protein [Aggregatilineales bacterium]
MNASTWRRCASRHPTCRPSRWATRSGCGRAVGSSRWAGSWVFALGFPYGVESGMSGGVVIGSGVGREWLALSLRLRPGHSGGLLLNAAGELVGINTLISGPEVGFAIPVHVVKRFLKAQLGVTEAPRAASRSESVVIL